MKNKKNSREGFNAHAVKIGFLRNRDRGDAMRSFDPDKVEPKVGRNDPCPCESGKKFKKCCGAPKKPGRYAAYTHMDDYPMISGGPYADDATEVKE